MFLPSWTRVVGVGFCLFLCFHVSAKGSGPSPTCKEKYNAETKFLANPDESVLIAGVIGWCRNHQTRLIWDERYAEVARLWSGFLINEQVSSERLLPMDRLRFELRQRGVTDSAVNPFSVDGPVEKMPPAMLQFLDEQVAKGRYTHFAVGVNRRSNQQGMMSTLILGRRPSLIEPLPVCPLPGSRLDLRLQLLRGYSHPSWLLTPPKGEIVRDNLSYDEGVWSGTVPLDGGAGEYQMEVVVEGPAGPEVAALFPLYVGVERPRIPTVKLRQSPGRYRTPDEAEKALTDLINKSRFLQGLPPLNLDQKLSAVAREHSMQLLVDRYASHRTSATGTLLDRLRNSGISFTRALENVSLSPSPEIAHDRFMESPGHRLNILDPNVNHVGIGVAMERGNLDDILAVTEVFIEPPESDDVAEIAQRLHRLINEKRLAKGRFALGLDRDLSLAALRSARRLVALGNKADSDREGRNLIKELNDSIPDLSDVQVRYFRTTNLSQILISFELLDENINRLGIGVSKTDTTHSVGDFWITVIFAGR